MSTRKLNQSNNKMFYYIKREKFENSEELVNEVD